MNAMRKVRKDAVLQGLPAAQRAKVDGWLFDKGLTYQAVAQACACVFGVKVSRSSVARYYERRMREELRRKRKETIRREVEGIKKEERYELLLTRMGELALEGAEDGRGRRGWRWIIEITKLLIAARREQNERMWVMVMRKKFEMWAAKACLKHVRMSRHGVKAERLAAQGRIARQYDQEWKAWKLRERERSFNARRGGAEKFQANILAGRETAREKSPSPCPNGFPSPPRVSCPKEAFAGAKCGPPMGARVRNLASPGQCGEGPVENPDMGWDIGADGRSCMRECRGEI